MDASLFKSRMGGGGIKCYKVYGRLDKKRWRIQCVCSLLPPYLE